MSSNEKPSSDPSLEEIDLEPDPDWPELTRGRSPKRGVKTAGSSRPKEPSSVPPSQRPTRPPDLPRDSIPTLHDDDPLRHDVVDEPRQVMPTLADEHPLRHDSPEGSGEKHRD